MTERRVSQRGLRVAVVAAVIGTVLLALGAFVLSFTALRDLAERSGIDQELGWLWPGIVDGIIVVATVAVFALAGARAVWYPWLLLVLGASVSIAANALHAIVAAEASVPPLLAAGVASIPPIVLVAVTHLTALLIHQNQHLGQAVDQSAGPPDGPAPSMLAVESEASTTQAHLPSPSALRAEAAQHTGASHSASEQNADLALLPMSDSGRDPRRALAAQLRDEGLNNAQVARLIGVDRSTIGRWLPRNTTEEQEA